MLQVLIFSIVAFNGWNNVFRWAAVSASLFEHRTSGKIAIKPQSTSSIGCFQRLINFFSVTASDMLCSCMLWYSMININDEHDMININIEHTWQSGRQWLIPFLSFTSLRIRETSQPLSGGSHRSLSNRRNHFMIPDEYDTYLPKLEGYSAHDWTADQVIWEKTWTVVNY